jgi:hydrogenase-4 component E
MTALLHSMLVLVLLLNLLVLGTSRISAVIRTVALQGLLRGLMPLLVHEELVWHVFLLSGATLFVKCYLIPTMLARAMREAEIKREVEPLIGLVPSMVLGAIATGLSVGLATRLPLLQSQVGVLIVPAALSTVLVGFILLTTRVKAISQVLGYLVLENGIFIFGLLLLEAMPFLVEVGVLLDLLVMIFVVTIILNHINREFASLDTRRLSSLKE